MVTNSSSAQIDLYREVLTILVQVGYDTLIVLPLRKCSRQIRAIASTVSITPPTARFIKPGSASGQLRGVNFRGTKLHAE
jgi:hypothetical protein